MKNHYEYLKSKYEIRGIHFLDTMDIDISSTRIRELLISGGDIKRYVPEDVCRYIREKRIYA